MCYDGTLVMPSSYVVMDGEEMTYVEGGGWGAYKGLEALGQILAICGAGATCAILTKKAGEALVASASTGVGLVLSLGLAVGVSLGIVASACEFGLAVCAAGLMIKSYNKYKKFSKSGFKACSYSIWTFWYYTVVEAL